VSDLRVLADEVQRLAEGRIGTAFGGAVALAKESRRVAADRERLREALERIRAQQPMTLETLRRNGVVFDGPLGNDPGNWQHVAFTIYTDLCETESIARAALAAAGDTGAAPDPRPGPGRVPGLSVERKEQP
jgi:hypothetical protein